MNAIATTPMKMDATHEIRLNGTLIAQGDQGRMTSIFARFQPAAHPTAEDFDRFMSRIQNIWFCNIDAGDTLTLHDCGTGKIEKELTIS